jgi:hypothetical protein
VPSTRTVSGLAYGLLAVYFAAILVHVQPAISGPDAAGYFLQGAELASTGHGWQAAESPLQFVAPNWSEGLSGRYYSKHPPGLPLLLGAFDVVFGTGGALWVDPLLTALCLLGLFLLCRRWLGAVWGLAALAAMIANPIVNHHVLGGFAHAAVSCVLIWGVYALSRWREEGGFGWAMLAGAAVGVLPSLRYPELLFGAAFGVAILHHALSSPRERERERRWVGPLAALVGFILPIGALAARNLVAFGAVWRTGYSASHEQGGFGWGYFADNWHDYLSGLVEGLGLLGGLAVAGLAVMLSSRPTRWRGALIVGLVLPTTILYCAYYWDNDEMSQRFLLPTYYLYAVAAVHLLAALPSRAAAAAVATVAILWGAPQAREQLAEQSTERAAQARLGTSVSGHVPNGAVLFTERASGQQLAYLHRWRLASVETILARPDRPPPGESTRPRPVNRQPENAARYRDLFGTERRAAVAADVDTWAGSDDATVWFLVTEPMLLALTERLSLNGELQEVAHLELPGSASRRERRSERGKQSEGAGRRGRRPQEEPEEAEAGALLLMVWER